MLARIGLIATIGVLTMPSPAADWKPATAAAPIMTRWAKDVSPTNAHPEYPRPQMVRKEWQNLNGLWDLGIVEDATSGIAAEPPKSFDTKILVPYPVESALSGVGKRAEHVWYRRTFEVPKEWAGKAVRLNFEAVDYQCRIFINGKQVTEHTGGYDPFSITLQTELKPGGPQELMVAVYDPTDKADQPRGKQVTTPKGIWYTPSTGIWQTVWMEPVDASLGEGIRGLKIVPDIDNAIVRVTVPSTEGIEPGFATKIEVLDGTTLISSTTVEGTSPGTGADGVVLPVKSPKLWSPDSPFLYSLRITALHNGKQFDQVESYFGMRKIEIKSDGKFQRIHLNGKEIFQTGPLDQGFWPDGLHTAPTDEAMRWDLEETKRLGFNMLRKHIKVEPARWYYWADKLGILVWQDIPSGNNKTEESKKEFASELQRMIAARGNSPAIVMWVVFNEGWGEFDKAGVQVMVDMVKKLDPTRLVNNASGWTDMGCGDVVDMHKYPGPGSPDPETTRASVLGEFGGLGLKIDGHTWSQEHWGYQGTSDKENLMSRYEQLMRRVWALKDEKGLCAAVYTQTTDVETETNGLITYDREVIKVDEKRTHDANTGKLPAVEITEVVPTSEKTPQTWRYTFTEPAKDWNTAAFDDTAWQQGPGGFGKGEAQWPIRTKWDTKEIWLRRDIEIPQGTNVDQLYLNVFHDEDVKIFINGEQAARENGYRTAYEELPIGDKARQGIKPGTNKLAVYCKNKDAAQYIDVGLITIHPKK